MAGTVIKRKKVEELKKIINERSDFIIVDCSGINVPKQNDLRLRIRKDGGQLKIVKNTLFHEALKQKASESANKEGGVSFSNEIVKEFAKDLKGPVSLAFAGKNFPGLSKSLLDFSKEVSVVKIKSACLKGAYLDVASVSQMASLPSQEEILTMIARGLNAPATKIALGIKELMSALARAIKAVSEKNN